VNGRKRILCYTVRLWDLLIVNYKMS